MFVVFHISNLFSVAMCTFHGISGDHRAPHDGDEVST